MKTRTLPIVLLLAIVALCIAGTKVSQLRRTTTIASNDLFMIVRTTDGRKTNMNIEARYLAPGLGPWITNSGTGGGGSATNAQPPSTVLTNLSNTGVAPGATNASAYVGSAGGRGTNIHTVGFTNTGAFSNTGPASIGGALDVGGAAEFRNSAAVYTELNVFGDINQDTVGGYTTRLGPTTHLTNSVTDGTNESRWVKFALLAPDSVLKTDANRLASVDDALTWASARLNESTNRLPWRVVPGDNISNLFVNLPNNAEVLFAPGDYTVNASILNSNYNRGTTYIGLLLADKTNITFRFPGHAAVLNARASLGTMLYITNCSGITFEGGRFAGYTNFNFTQLPGYSPITTNQGAYLWASIEYYKTEKLRFDGSWIDGSVDHGIWDRAVNDSGYPASDVASTNQIEFFNVLATQIGSFRTNSTSPTTGFALDGTALVPTVATIRGLKVRDSLRAVEPYNENEAAGYVFTGTTLEDFEFRNLADIGFGLFGTSTNGHWGTVRRGKIENDAAFTWHGTNYGRTAANQHGGYGIFLASGRGWTVEDVEIAGTMWAALYIGNATTPCDDFVIRNVTARDIISGDQVFGVGAYIGSFGTNSADAVSVRRLLLSGFEANNCAYGGIQVYGGRDIVIEGFRSFRPSTYAAANTVFSGLRIGRNGLGFAGITNITVRGSRQFSDGYSAWGIAVENNVHSAKLYDNEATGFTIAALTNQSTSANIEFPEWNFRSATNIATSTFRATNTASVGTLHFSGGHTASRVAMFNAQTNLTNVVSSDPANEYVKADGTVGVPSGSGDVSTAQLLYVSNQVQVVSNSMVANDTTTSNGLFSVETTRNAAVSNALAALLVANDTTTSNGLFSVETTRNAAVSNALVTLLAANDTTTSNALVTLLLARGTNFPPVINQLGGTNLAVDVGVRKVVTITTNASFAFNLSGTPANGMTFIVGVSNFSASAIYMTTFVASASSSAYFPANASNVTVFAIPPTSIRWLEFLSETNFNLGTARWNIIRDQGKEMELAAGVGMLFATNAAGTYITQSVHTVLQNLIGTVANNVTNENSTALVISAGTLAVSPGNVSNLVNNTTIDFQPGNVITNLGANKFAIWTNYVQTGSNYVFSFNTNHVELKNQTNVIFTNIVEELTGVAASIEVHIHNTTGVTMGLVWPAYGAQHGYFLQTNVNNPIITTTSLAAGQHGIAAIKCFGTNLFATFTTWP